MATYNLEQQEQLDQVKHLWAKYGNLVTWALIAVLGAYAAWTGYGYWQKERAVKAAGLYEEMDRAVQAGDLTKANQAFLDLKDKYGGTVFSEHGALLAGKVQADKGKDDAARAALTWLVDNGKNPNLVAVARLRLAGLLLDAKQYGPALAQLQAEMPEEFQPLAHDRRGDVLSAQGKREEAVKAYGLAWKGMDTSVEYRRFVESKLTALGHPPAPPAAASAPSVP